MTTAQRIYLDVCCLNRPFDDQSQERIRLESEAIVLIISRLQSGDWVWLGGDAIDYEIDQTPDPERQRRVRVLATAIQHSVPLTQTEVTKAKELQSLGFKQWDALHLACAESGQADVFLTTDDRLRRLAHRVAAQLKVRVENPLTWLTEVIE